MTDISVITQDVLIITITPPHGPAVVLDPIGQPGTPGSDGDTGWTAVTAIVADGSRSVLRIVDYIAGEGTKPTTNIGKYVGVSGPVTDIAQGVDIRGLIGPQGAKGDQGDAGAVVIGEGTDILTGAGAPSDGIGIDNELYIDTVTGNLYKKLSGHWVLQASLKGPKGDQGDQGIQGDPGDQGTPGVAGQNGAAGAAGAAGAKGDQGEPGAAGAAGATGKSIHVGSGAPSSGLGNVSDSYVDQANFNYYMKVSSTVWTLLGNLKGANGSNGADGADGATIITGSGAPSNGTGNDLDLYIRTSNGDVYHKIGGAWGSPIMNITGPAGAQGIQGVKGDKGDDGDAGPAGSQILNGLGAPSGGLGADGDFYINDTTHHYYIKDAGAWADQGVLAGDKGDQGDQGIQGIQGIKGDDGDPGTDGTDGSNGSNGTDGAAIFTGSGAPSDGSGVDGDLYVNTANGDLYQKVAGHWGSPVGNLRGPTGATGAAGTNGTNGTNGTDGAPGAPGAAGSAGARGSVWSTASSVPGNSAPTGVLDGDFFLLSTTGEVYKHVSGVWTDQGFSIVGPQGAAGSAGSAGARGSLWYTASSVPATGLPSGVAAGDFFVLSTTGEIYKYVGTTWTDQSFSIQGPQGATGATGASGGGGGGGAKIMHYLFETSTTNSAPASGKFRFSIASFNGGSGGDDTWKIYINKTDNDGGDQSAYWVGGASGVVSRQFLGKKIIIADVSTFPDSNTTQPYQGKITAITDHTGYVELSVEQIAAANGTNFAANQDCVVYVIDMPDNTDVRGGVLNSSSTHAFGIPSLRIGGINNAFAPTASTMYCIPFDLKRAAFFNSVHCDVLTAATAATGTFRIMILRRQRNYSGTPIAGGASISAGTAQSSGLASTGMKAINLFLEMGPGQYWLCLAISTFSGSPILNAFKCMLPEEGNDLSVSGTTWSRVQTFTVSGDKTGGLSTMPAISAANTVAIPTSGNDGFQFLAPAYLRWSYTG